MEETKKRVLVVGAGGFTGGFICEEGLRRGYEVWAGVRESTSRRYLSDPRLKFVVFDFDKPETLPSSLKSSLPDGEKWDYIVYNLGATKCVNFLDFNKINYIYLQDFCKSLELSRMVPEKMVYMSSLSAMGPGDEKGFTPFDESRIPMPNTRYGASKLKAEMWLAASELPVIILRPTGIYGPRDRDYFLMFDAIRKGFDFSVGYKKQLLSFLYVEDLAKAVYDALEKAPVKKTYIIGESRSYTQKEFRNIVGEAIGKRMVLPVRLPLWIVKGVSKVSEKIGVAKGKPSTLNSDKFKIMAQRNWNVDVSAAEKDFGFKCEIPLEEGVKKSVEWYKAEGWL